MANKFLTNINLTAGLEASGTVGTSGQVLSSTGSGVQWITPSSGVGGSGTANKMTRWISSTVLGNSTLSDNGTTVSASTSSSADLFNLTKSGSGDAIKITSSGAGDGININKSSGSGYAIFAVGKSSFDGNVGIGTGSSAVSQKLRVDGNVQFDSGGDRVAEFNATGAEFAIGDLDGLSDEAIISGDGGVITISNSGSPTLTADLDNRIGIGTINPATTLDVDGSIRVADDGQSPTSANVGALKYIATSTSSSVEMCMQTGNTTYAWIKIATNFWF